MPQWILSPAGAVWRLRKNYRLLIAVANIFGFALAGASAFLLRFEFTIPLDYRSALVRALLIWIAVKIVVFHFHGLGNGWWRFVSVPDIVRITAANCVASAISAVLIVLSRPGSFPRSVYVIDFVLCLLVTAGPRLAIRIAYDLWSQRTAPTGAKRVFIYGAGCAGVMLLRETRWNAALGYSVQGFIDDDPHKAGMRVQRVQVLGNGDDLPRLAAAHAIEEVLIAIPTASGPQMKDILSRCHDAGVRFRTVPALADVIQDRALAAQIRDVAVEDLLGRSPVRLEEKHIRAKVHGQVVLVTGAAGSIGSEICRQLLHYSPRAIVALENGENALFHLDLELRQLCPTVTFHARIGDIRDRRRVEEVIAEHRPAMVFHAAAYKHVPMMEAHMFEAVRNNILGTYNVATVAAQYGVSDFVMISSDKAVRPANIMGATKRVAEMFINSLGTQTTKFVSVRFGNVLGSNGSVVPLFKRQIASGGPVTVTHPDMRRYFMTIPEAVQLVLQASTMGAGGEVFVLDMGEPVRIVDLARNLILLSGRRPGDDIRIVFSGVRPGEKLYEELSTTEEGTVPTSHEKIRAFRGLGLDSETAAEAVAELERICIGKDKGRLILWLKRVVPDYSASTEILEQLLSLDSAAKTDGAAGRTPRPAIAPVPQPVAI